MALGNLGTENTRSQSAAPDGPSAAPVRHQWDLKAKKGKLPECGTHQDDIKLPDFSSSLARAAEGKYHYTDRRNDDKRRSER